MPVEAEFLIRNRCQNSLHRDVFSTPLLKIVIAILLNISIRIFLFLFQRNIEQYISKSFICIYIYIYILLSNCWIPIRLRVKCVSVVPQIKEALVYGSPVVNESSPFTFFCSVNSSTTTNISIMNLNTSEMVTSVFNKSFLNHTEESARCSHMASYICIAENAVGKSESSPMQIFVNCEPRSRNGLSYYDVIMDINSTLDITAVLEAFPSPSFAWTFRHTSTGPQIPVSADYKMTVTNLNASTFLVRLQRDFISRELLGYYTVKAKNEMGFFTTVFYVNQQGTCMPLYSALWLTMKSFIVSENNPV